MGESKEYRTELRLEHSGLHILEESLKYRNQNLEKDYHWLSSSMIEPLYELALNYPVRCFSNESTCEGHPSFTVFPIERCIPDILVAIFQTLIDDESAGIDPRRSAHSINPQAAARLALVCKEWKEIVYNVPSLWSLIKIHANNYLYSLSPVDLLQKLIRRAKGAPVDLHIFGFPADFSNESAINSLLSVVPNIRKLHVELVTPPEVISPPLLLSRSWAALQNVRELSYHVPTLGDMRADLTAHLIGMPRLVSLWLNEPGLTIPYRTPQGPALLPRLKKLALTGLIVPRDNTGAKITPSFLSHCPEIEELDLALTDPNNSMPIENAIFFGSQMLPLPQLRKLKSSGTLTLAPFISSRITTPTLVDLALFNYTDRWASSIAQLVTQNAQTLTSLYLFVLDHQRFHCVLTPLVHLTSLSFLAIGEGLFLALLYENLVLPSLRFFTLSMHRSSLSASQFSKFVVARCIPVTVNLNAQRMTGARYSALENFVLIALDSPMLLQYVRQTPEWKIASVSKPRSCVFEMWWDVQAEGGTDAVDS